MFRVAYGGFPEMLPFCHCFMSIRVCRMPSGFIKYVLVTSDMLQNYIDLAHINITFI